MSFVHLRLHSEFSLIDSLVRVGDAVKQCQKHKMPALALTDLGNLYGLVKFYKAAQGKGVKPIFGADLRVIEEGGGCYIVTVFAMNEKAILI
jgi:DNA polymerase-3 subunit alpha